MNECVEVTLRWIACARQIHVAVVLRGASPAQGLALFAVCRMKTARPTLPPMSHVDDGDDENDDGALIPREPTHKLAARNYTRISCGCSTIRDFNNSFCSIVFVACWYIWEYSDVPSVSLARNLVIA